MRSRIRMVFLIALLAGTTGCAGTARRDDGSSIFGPRAWNAPPSPPQRAVTLTAGQPDAVIDPAPRRIGISKYFPDLLKKAPKTPQTTVVATKPRLTWFGLRSPKPAVTPTTTYMTDTREHLNRSDNVPTALPVALQVPTDRPASESDRMVKAAGAENVADQAPSRPIDDQANAAPSVPDFGGKPARPGEDEVNPLPPAAEPGTPEAIVNRMPQIPAVDPLSNPPAEPKAPEPASSAVVAASDDQAIKASTPPDDTKPPVEGPKPVEAPKPATSQIVETSKIASPTPPVYASPQSSPPKPTVVVKHAPHVKASPQGAAFSETWKRPCLRRLVRKVCKIGEFADPPTAAPH